MKTTRSSDFRGAIRSIAVAILTAPFLPAAFSATGTWTGAAVPADGLWSNASNWALATIADGSTFTADFTTLDLSGDTTVHLDGARTISALTFGDSNTTSSASWILDDNGNAANILTLGASPTITVNALGTGKNVTINTILAGTLGMNKAGAGTLVLTQANTYTGTTNIAGGTLALSGGDNRLNTAVSLNFSGAGILDLGSAIQTLANLTVANGTTGTVTGTGGKLIVSPATFRLGSTAAANQTLTMSGLSSFEYNNSTGTFEVSNTNGGGSGTTTNLTLAASNTITASTIAISRTAGVTNSGTNAATVNLGHDNVFNADTILVANFQRGTSGTLQFQTGLAANPSLIIRGTAGGTSRASNVTVAENSGASTGTQPVTGTVDLTGISTASVDAMIGALTIGKNSRGNAGGNRSHAAGTFTMGSGTLDATSIVVAQTTSALTNTAASSATGTFNLGTATIPGGLVKVGSLTLGDQPSTTNNVTVSATFNLNNGGTLQAQTIQAGVTGSGAITSTFNWSDGTIQNYDSSTDLTIGAGPAFKLAATGTHTFDIGSSRTATMNAVLSDATSGGTLVKGGNGALVLAALNTYTGNTTINGGTVNLADNAQLRFKIGGNDVNNKLTGTGALTLDGDFAFDLTGASTTIGDTWHIVDVANLNETFSSTFSVASFTDIGSDLWQTTANGATYQFSEATGDLAVVPEPGAFAAMLGGIGILLGTRRRRVS